MLNLCFCFVPFYEKPHLYQNRKKGSVLKSALPFTEAIFHLSQWLLNPSHLKPGRKLDRKEGCRIRNNPRVQVQ